MPELMGAVAKVWVAVRWWWFCQAYPWVTHLDEDDDDFDYEMRLW